MIKIDSIGTEIDKKEITAYIQQQMVDLAPHLEEKSALQIRLTQVNKGYEAELTAVHLEGEIQTVGWDENLYVAIKNVKEGLLQYFVEVEDELNPHQREEKINHFSRNGNLYLH